MSFIAHTVPFEEDDHDPSIWFLDHSYLEIMYRMFKKVNGEQAQLLRQGSSAAVGGMCAQLQGGLGVV